MLPEVGIGYGFSAFAAGSSYSRSPMMHFQTMAKLGFLVMTLLYGCTPESRPLPTGESDQDLDQVQEPPLYQLLYDIPALPSFGQKQQRVRILIWLRHLSLSESQLIRLDELRLLANDRRSRIEQAEMDAANKWEREETLVHDKIWSAMAEGKAVDDASMAPFTHELKEMRSGGERERELLKLRLQRDSGCF